MATNRALTARTARLRSYYLEASIQEFDYIIQRVPQNFVLLPEILTKKGENLIRIGGFQAAVGIRELQSATMIKPDYWPAYAALSDYYKSNGDLAKARDWLEKGLTATPGAKSLERRVAELNGARISSRSRSEGPQEHPPTPPDPAVIPSIATESSER
jgi:tetratricopeptide (TPR) repeat protein